MNMTSRFGNALSRLLQSPLELTYKDSASSRQLKAARLNKNLTLKLALKAIVQPADGAMWEAHRKTLGNGQVLCPECEISDGEPKDCTLCGGVGVVSRLRWDEWYFDSRDCVDYHEGCEGSCEKTSCVRDIARAPQGALVLMLKAATSKGSMKDKGNSVEGFETEGLCDNPQALRRFLNTLAVSCGCIAGEDFGDDEEDEENDE